MTSETQERYEQAWREKQALNRAPLQRGLRHTLLQPLPHLTTSLGSGQFAVQGAALEYLKRVCGRHLTWVAAWNDKYLRDLREASLDGP